MSNLMFSVKSRLSERIINIKSYPYTTAGQSAIMSSFPCCSASDFDLGVNGSFIQVMRVNLVFIIAQSSTFSELRLFQ